MFLADWLRRRRVGTSPVVGDVRFGDLRRAAPLSRTFGFDRGRPVDRYYIERFLERNAADIRGRVLEVGDDGYTCQFGGAAVTTHDVLHVDTSNPRATIIDDLAHGQAVPSDAFDCIILTQTLHLIYDVRAAAATLERALRPGGVCLLTVPGISQIDAGAWGDSWYWAFSPHALHRVLIEHFPPAAVEVESHGSVLSATAFLYGLAAEELEPQELDTDDPCYPLVVAARAVKVVGSE